MPRSLSRYSAVAIALHWLIALAIIGNIGLAWTFNKLPKGTLFFDLIQLHKSVGITVLVLSVARLAWRVGNPPPPLPDSLKPWEKAASQAVHWGFYLIMIGLPLSGWAMVSASTFNLPTILFKTIPWPHIGYIHDLPMDARKVWSHNSEAVHGLFGKLTYVLILLHVGAALKHQFIDRDAVLSRMIPFLRPKAA